MHKLNLALCFLFSFFLALMTGLQNARAIDTVIGSDSLVISSLQVGPVGGLSNEFIELYNNNPNKIEITNWCMKYASASSTNWSNKVCFTPENTFIHFFIPGHSSIFLSAKEFNPVMKSDWQFSATMSAIGGHIKLVDNTDNEIDRVGWGTATYAESESPAIVINDGRVINRKVIGDVFQDTDNNLDDFYLALPKSNYTYGSIIEVQDICQNIIDIQESIPPDMVLNSNNQCVIPPKDLCPNTPEMDLVIPVGYLLDERGDCQKDICLNTPELEISLPPNKIIYENNCYDKPLPLQITELLPNAIGSDNGNEFIEIYNPNNVEISLLDYVFYLSSDYDHFYSFPVGVYIEPGKYLSFLNDDLNFNLTNVNGVSVRLMSLGKIIDETPVYENASDGMAWALINNVWQYTNQPTPNKINLSSLVEADIKVIVPVVTIAPCKDGQYRSEETHRCRNIVSDVVDLVPCAEGQERNPATNRCRNITTAVLGENDLKPCDIGQERNPETNRCRNIIAAVIPVADYAPEQVDIQQTDYTSWYIIAGLGVVAIGYGAWEWRVEFGRIFKKLFKIK